MIGTLRRELFDRILIVNEHHYAGSSSTTCTISTQRDHTERWRNSHRPRPRPNPHTGSTEFVMSAANVLHEGVSDANHADRAEPFQAEHRPEPGLQFGRDPAPDLGVDTRAGQRGINTACPKPPSANVTVPWRFCSGWD